MRRQPLPIGRKPIIRDAAHHKRAIQHGKPVQGAGVEMTILLQRQHRTGEDGINAAVRLPSHGS